MEITAPSGYDGKVSLFRTVWLLHSGELFGKVGVLVVDVISVLLIIICVTGLAFWLTAKISVRQSLKRLNMCDGMDASYANDDTACAQPCACRAR